ncbi:MAG: archaemetzincin family Zn-dependent metalloprotease [Candidatus Wallbacteria bacterium]|nr:archaemetzincin family Zn-dependent metalloprotease [Candidatus Wallbacteria bacterium]
MPLHVIPIYLAGHELLLPDLRCQLEETFGLPTTIATPRFDPEVALEPARAQYNSRTLLSRLLDEVPGPRDRVLGVCGVDLFIPVLTFVFGEAQLDGRAAAVSLYRLKSEMYGLPASPALLAERLRKEAVHELGHTYGLVHCVDPACVMHSSTYVEEIDLKSPRFCPRCAAAVGSGHGSGKRAVARG